MSVDVEKLQVLPPPGETVRERVVEPVPRHVAIIMDGNGRWAERRALPRIDGHAAGELAVTATVDAAYELGVEYLTLFAFSTENWRRPWAEVEFLMDFNKRLIEKLGPGYHERGIRVRYLGSASRLIPEPVTRAMAAIEELTAENRRLTLSFAFNHGGRQEIVDAVRLMVARGVRADQIDDDVVSSYFQYPETPDPDLIVRTSGEHRLSNFLLWGAAYAELVFVDTLWPDFRGEDLRAALEEFGNRSRRFGGLSGRTAVDAAIVA